MSQPLKLKFNPIITRKAGYFISALFSCIGLFAQAPTAGFTATPVNGCAPVVVNFTDQSTGNPSSWQWNLGNGVTSNSQNPSTFYSIPGTYTITLTVTNASGSNTITRTNYITVNSPPTPNFMANNTSGCFPLRVQFSDLSDPGFGTITSWNWSFGTGATSTQQNPQYLYTTAGNFSVSLTVTNSAGCTKTIVRPSYISVSGGVKADFSFSKPQNCSAPEDISFTNSSSGPPFLSYEWDFGDGKTSSFPNPVNTYYTSGPFTVRLITKSSQGCTDTVIKSNIIKLNNYQSLITGPDSACVNAPINLQNTSVPSPDNSFWDFGDGTNAAQKNPVKTYTTAGFYFIKLVNDFTTCKDSVYKVIKISPRPVASFITTDSISCKAPHTVNFQNLSASAVTYQWDFGDGTTSVQNSPTHTYTDTGSYTVRLIAFNSSGCPDTLTRVSYVRVLKPVLKPFMLPADGCKLLNVQFFANSTSVDSILSWSWNFGNGNTSVLRNPTNTFDSGSYAVRLKIVTTQGCIDSTRIDSVRVGNKPKAAFSASPLVVCAFAPVQFTDLSTGNPNEWNWDFGDKSNAFQQNPVHSFQDTGLFTIRLIAYNNRCPDTTIISKYIQVLPPVAKFSYAVKCAVNKLQVNFSDQSIVAKGWTWNFGDGTTSNLQSPTHTFPSLGTYTVTLSVTNGSCTNQISKTIQLVDENPGFNANITTICKNGSVQFTGANFNSANIAEYEWNFGDGNATNVTNPLYFYKNSGIYTVRLVLKDINGCLDTLIKPNYINVNGPTAAFTTNKSQLCLGNQIILTNTSATDGRNALTNVKWNMGNGDMLSSLATPLNYTYPSAGTYDIQLVVTDASGCADSVTKQKVIEILNPKAKFSVDTPSCPGTVLQFKNQSIGGSGAESYFWNFGDGTTSTLKNLNHVYAATGQYPVKLLITEPAGCKDSVSIKIRIDTPKASFTVSDTATICSPFEAVFSNTSSFAESVSWDFGDGNISTEFNTTHSYVLPGNYLARLIIKSPGDCYDTAYQLIKVGRTTGALTISPLTGCAPLTVNLQTRTDIPLTYTWDLGDGNTSTTTDSNFVHVYDAGSYVPKLIITDKKGCFSIIESIDTIKALGSKPNFGVNNYLLCDSGTVQFIDSSFSNDIVTDYLWDFGDGTTSNSIVAPAHSYSAPGTYNVTLTVTTTNGCVNSKTKNALIKVVAAPKINIIGDSSFCMPANVLLQGQLLNPDTSAINWQWNIDGQIINLQNPPAVSRPSADTIFAQLIATNSSGCKDTASKIIVVHPLPTVQAGNDTTICLGTFATLQPSGAATYTWSPSTYLNCTVCTNPQAAVQNNIQYVVTGVSLYGCVNKDTMLVKVKKPFITRVGNGDTVCIDQSTRISANGAENYLWSPGTSLNDSTVSNPVASPKVTTTYTVTGYDSLNCFQSKANVSIVVYPYPVINAGPDTTIRSGSSINLLPQLSTDVTSVLWSPPTGLSCITCPEPVASPLKTTTYRIVASNPGTCSSYDDVKITVLCDRNNIFIPNAFTPNGDNINDRFYVMGNGLQSVKSLRIYNRWGNLIFEKTYMNVNDRLQGWDGTMNGQNATPGMYSYSAEIICGDGGIIPVSGAVVLIR